MDPASFGALTSVVSQVTPASDDSNQDVKVPAIPTDLAWKTPRVGAALMQLAPDPTQSQDDVDPQMEQKMEALGPVLNKLAGLDPKAFGNINNMLSQAEGPKK